MLFMNFDPLSRQNFGPLSRQNFGPLTEKTEERGRAEDHEDWVGEELPVDEFLFLFGSVFCNGFGNGPKHCSHDYAVQDEPSDKPHA